MATTAFTIPYHLRHHKAIDRNLFTTILRKLDRYSSITIEDYRYIGFGAPFLEDFKIMHNEFGILDMHCIEQNQFAYSRQRFNNPYSFVKLYNEAATEYLTGPHFKLDRPQIVWLDFASPGKFREQLRDIELLGEKAYEFDIFKFTFNASFVNFVSSNDITIPIENDPENMRLIEDGDYKSLFNFLSEDGIYRDYFPDQFKPEDLIGDISIVFRAMGMRAITRGIRRRTNELNFYHISSFHYQDGQPMTTFCGIICKEQNFNDIINESGLRRWEFYQRFPANEMLKAHKIEVPSMTVPERIAIDKMVKTQSPNDLATNLVFSYGSKTSEHKKLIQGYCKYYKYLPYYTKVTF